MKSLSGPEIEKMKKNVVRIFKDCGLIGTIEANLHTVNYLDVTFDLRKNTFLLYRKQDSSVFINNYLNYPSTVTKQILKSLIK